MPLDIGESINYVADLFLKAPAIYRFAKNPIYTSILIVFIIMLIVMFVFKAADTEESLLIMCLRVGFWSFILICGVMFIHNKVLSGDVKEKELNAAYNGIFDANYNVNDSIPVPIMKPPGYQLGNQMGNQLDYHGNYQVANSQLALQPVLQQHQQQALYSQYIQSQNLANNVKID